MEPTLPSERKDALVAPSSTATTSLAGPPKAGASPDSESSSGSPVGRRIVLGMIGLGAVGVLLGRQAQEAITSTVSATVPGLGSIIPAAGGFRIYTVTGGYPAMDPADYRLDVTGNVTRHCR